MSIRWKEDEEQKLALRFAELTHEAEVSDTYLSWIGAMLQAQEEVLPADRRRPKDSLQATTPKQKERLRKLGFDLMKAKKQVQAEEDKNFARFQEQQTHRERAVSVKPHEIIQEVHEVPPQLPLFPTVDQMMEAMVTSVTENFRLQLRARMNRVINEEFEGIHEQISSELQGLEQTALNRLSQVVDKVQGLAQKRKVVLVGVNQNQFNELEQEYGAYVKLDWVDMKKSASRLKSAARSADFVIANTHAIGHHHSNVLRGHPGLRHANGGSGSVKDLLLEICTS